MLEARGILLFYSIRGSTFGRSHPARSLAAVGFPIPRSRKNVPSKDDPRVQRRIIHPTRATGRKPSEALSSQTITYHVTLLLLPKPEQHYNNIPSLPPSQHTRGRTSPIPSPLRNAIYIPHHPLHHLPSASTEYSPKSNIQQPRPTSPHINSTASAGQASPCLSLALVE